MGGFVCHFAESCPGRATGRRAHPEFAKRARPPLLVSRAAGRTDCSWLASFLGGLVHLGSSAAGHALSAHPSSLRPGAVGCQAKVRRVTRAGCFLAVLHAFAYFHPSKFTLTGRNLDRKSTRLNSSHGYISYAVFCLNKKQHISH